MTEPIRAVRCLTPVCARLTTYKAKDPPPQHCPVCAGPVEPVPLQPPRRP
jgi:prepilin signal peptidase PulO-like enzyme (type II secretory pathway)